MVSLVALAPEPVGLVAGGSGEPKHLSTLAPVGL